MVVFDAVKPPLATANLATPTADAFSGQRALSKPLESRRPARRDLSEIRAL